MRQRRRLLRLILAGFLSLLIPAAVAADPTVQYTGGLSYDVVHDADITWSTGGGSSSDVTLEVFLPAPMDGDWSEQSGLTAESLTEFPGSVVQGTTHLQGGPIAEYLYYTANYQTSQPTRLRYSYTITARNTTLSGGTFDAISATLSQAAAAGGLANYRASSTSIEADHADIVTLKDAILTAEGIDPSSGLAKDAVKAFYDWVKAHMVYDYAYGTGFEGTGKLTKYSGPYYNGSYLGQCGDYSAILVALCRAAGIPARPVVGFWVGGSANQTHVWAEIYFPSLNAGAGGWVPADATADQGAGYQHLGELSDGNQRLVVTKGFDLTLTGTMAYACPLLQIYYWAWAYSGGTPLRVPSVSYTLTGTSASTTRTITATVSGQGTISPSGAVLVAQGSNQQFTFTPANTNYAISDVTVDGASVGTPATYTFSNVTANHTIAVTFAIDPANYDGDGNGTPDASEANTESFSTSGAPGELTTVCAPATATVNSAAHVAVPSGAPSSLSFPYGFVSFDLTVTGANSGIALFVPYDARIDGYYKMNQVTGAYENIATGVSAITGPPAQTRLDFTLTDGGSFDEDGVANLGLLDPGGPGFASTASASASTAGGGSENRATVGVPFGGEALSVIVAAAYGLYSLRRRDSS